MPFDAKNRGNFLDSLMYKNIFILMKFCSYDITYKLLFFQIFYAYVFLMLTFKKKILNIFL